MSAAPQVGDISGLNQQRILVKDGLPQVPLLEEKPSDLSAFFRYANRYQVL